MTVFLPAEKDLHVETDQIQGNVLPGFKADHEHLRGLRFESEDAARTWIRHILPHITTADDVYAHRRKVHKLDAGPSDHSPWATVAFTSPGLNLLQFPGTFNDAAFRHGIEGAAEQLGDDPAQHACWSVGGAKWIHALLIVAAADCDGARTHSDMLTAIEGITEIYRDEGGTRPGSRGHEHFGFRDGVSHPGLFGKQKTHPEYPLTERDWSALPNDASLQAIPGTVLLWPGEFVFGYSGVGQAARAPGPTVNAGSKGQQWTKNGSLLVLRRLQQHVSAFHNECRTIAAGLVSTGAWPSMTPELLEALIVGRWPDGTPVDARTEHTPSEPVVYPGLVPNGFDFGDDGGGDACPFAAHIRKVNPRAQTSVDARPDERRLLRRGIPYGPDTTDRYDDDGQDRGLLFLSFQTSIVEQFQRLVAEWMNDPDQPAHDGAGHDVLVGQIDGPRRMNLRRNGRDIAIETESRWITPTGGAYCFAPSLFALNMMATH